MSLLVNYTAKDVMKRYKEELLQRIGWTIFIVECQNKSFFSGVTRDLKKELTLINVFKKGKCFQLNPGLLPVVLIYEEIAVPWKEAYVKLQYLRFHMNKRMKLRLVRTKKWPYGGPWKKFLEENPDYKNKLT